MDSLLQHIAFVGDSITDQGGQPGGYIDRLKQTLSDRPITISHYGLSGGRAADLWTGKSNWSKTTPYADILKTMPTILVLYIGVNDIWHEPPTIAADFRSTLTELVSQAKQTGAIVILATPAVIGENLEDNPKNALLDRFSQIAQAVAADQQITLCNLRQAFVVELQRGNSNNRDRGIFTTDGVHMNDQGNQLIADCMARSLLAVGVN
jgi:isoamyl acetate esterase